MLEKVITIIQILLALALSMAKDGSTIKVCLWGSKMFLHPDIITMDIWNYRWGASEKMVLSSGLAPMDKEL